LKLEHIPYVPGSTLDIITPSVGTSCLTATGTAAKKSFYRSVLNAFH